MMASKRLNFFKGLFTSAEDWQTEQEYHIEKQRAHNTRLHLPGVISGLEVKAAESGTAIQVSAGYAIDRAGRDLHLESDVQREIRFDDYPKPTVLSVVLQYKENKLEKRPHPTNPEFTNHAFIQEAPTLTLETKVPEEALSLATIQLNSANGKRIRNAADPTNPKENEIDIKNVPRAGAKAARASFKDAAAVAESGKIQLRPHREGGATDYEASVTWPAQTEDHAFHFASVYPVEGEGEVSWRMGSIREKGVLKYRLFIRNHGPRELLVAYRVYRFE